MDVFWVGGCLGYVLCHHHAIPASSPLFDGGGGSSFHGPPPPRMRCRSTRRGTRTQTPIPHTRRLTCSTTPPHCSWGGGGRRGLHSLSSTPLEVRSTNERTNATAHRCRSQIDAAIFGGTALSPEPTSRDPFLSLPPLLDRCPGPAFTAHPSFLPRRHRHTPSSGHLRGDRCRPPTVPQGSYFACCVRVYMLDASRGLRDPTIWRAERCLDPSHRSLLWWCSRRPIRDGTASSGVDPKQQRAILTELVNKPAFTKQAKGGRRMCPHNVGNHRQDGSQTGSAKPLIRVLM
jgi:hypothetical protein